MNIIEFTVDSYYNDVEESVLKVGLYGEGHFLSAQLTVPPASDDLPEELQSFLVERDDPGFATRLGIEKLILQQDQLKVELNEQGKKELQCEGIIVHFEFDPMQFLEFKITLLHIFEDLVNVE